MPEEAPDAQAPPPEPQPTPQPGTPPFPGGPSLVQPVLEPQPADNDKDVALDAIRQIERARRSRVLVYWTTPFAKMGDGSVRPCTTSSPQRVLRSTLT